MADYHELKGRQEIKLNVSKGLVCASTLCIYTYTLCTYNQYCIKEQLQN